MSTINCLRPKSKEEGLQVQFIILLTDPVGFYLVKNYVNYFDFYFPLPHTLDYVINLNNGNKN